MVDQKDEARVGEILDPMGRPIEVKEPEAPEGTKPERLQAIKAREAEFLAQVDAASGVDTQKLSLTAMELGVQSQRRTGQNLALMSERVARLADPDQSASSSVSGQIVKLREALERINPGQLTSPVSLVRRSVGWIPFLGNPLQKRLAEYMIKFETIGAQVAFIETGLEQGRKMLRSDSAQLVALRGELDADLQNIRENAYLGETLMSTIVSRMEGLDPESEKYLELRDVLYNLSVRVISLRSMEVLYLQNFAGIKITVQNNNELANLITNLLSSAMNFITVGLAIQTALARQRDVLKVVRETQDFIGNLAVSNAKAINQGVQELGDISANPIAALEKIQQAHELMLQAIQETDNRKNVLIASTGDRVAQLKAMSAEMEKAIKGLRAPDAKVEVKALEA